MRIHRIRLTDFRGVGSFEALIPDHGVTVLEGPNESGKSSLAEAIDLALEHPDSSAKAVVKSLKPVHRDVGTEVELELTTGPYRVVYTKRWNRQAGTTLRVLEPVPEQRTGRDAHDRMRGILDETLDPALWRALQVQQGSSGQPDLAASSALLQALDQAAATTIDAADDTLWQRVERERLLFWTPGGQANAERKHRGARLDQLTAEARRLAGSLAELDDVAERVRELGEQLAVLGAELLAAEAEQAGYRELAADVDRRRTEVDAGLRLVESAAQSVHRAARAEQDRAAAVAETEQAGRDAAAAEAGLEPDELEAALRAAQGERAAAAEARDRAERADGLAQARLARRRAATEVADLEERLTALAAARDGLVDAERRLEVTAPTAEDLRLLEAEYVAWRSSGEALRAGSPTVTVRADAPATVAVDGEAVAVTPGAPAIRSVADRATIRAGVVEIEVVAGAGAEALRDRETDAGARFAERCRRLGLPVDDALAVARDRRAEHVVAERDRHDAERRIRELLGGADEPLLQARMAVLRERLADDPAADIGEGDLQGLATDAAAELAEQRAEERRAEDRVAAARAELDAAADAARADETLATVRRDRADQAQHRLARQREEVPDEALGDESAATGRLLLDAEAALAASRAQLDALDPAQVRLLEENADGVVAGLATRLAECHRERTEHLAVLRARGGESLQEQADETAREAEHLRREQLRVERRAAAAALLHAVLDAQRRAARAAVARPYRDRLEALGRVVFGADLSVELGEDLRIVSRTLSGRTVPWDALSTGAKEQLAMLARLACAGIVSRDGGGAPVVLDDTFGHSDDARLRRIAALLATAGRSGQVLVLTASPDRFRGIGGAHVIRMPPAGAPGPGEEEFALLAPETVAERPAERVPRGSVA